MRRTAILGAILFLAIAAGAASGAREAGLVRPPQFREGVAAGEVTPSSALVWTRAPSVSAPLVLEVSTEASFRQPVRRRVCCARVASDSTLSVRLSDLRPATRYWYRFRQGASTGSGIVSSVGTFETAPAPTANATIRFALSGDADATPGADGKPGFNRFEVYGRMAAERNDFNVNLGDTIYSDSEIAGSPPALTVSQKWAKYRLGLALPALQRLRAATGLYSHWDDHEFVNDFTRAENGSAIYAAGVKAFTDYAPVAKPGKLGLFRSFRWGRNLELFFLDERTFRSAKADDACGNDLAPAAPQVVRNGFAALVPGLENPVSPECLAALDDPGRTMLGAAQYAAFTKAVKASTATWKVIVNEVPIQQFYALPYDRWEGYEAERERLLRFLQANVRNVVFLTTDTHANLVNEVRYSTLGGTPESSGIWEVVTGPVATNTFAKEIDNTLGKSGVGTAIGALFFKPAPPNGVGMRCAALDTYSYAEVSVAATTLRVALKDARGRPVREPTGAACVPLVLAAG